MTDDQDFVELSVLREQEGGTLKKDSILEAKSGSKYRIERDEPRNGVGVECVFVAPGKHNVTVGQHTFLTNNMPVRLVKE